MFWKWAFAIDNLVAPLLAVLVIWACDEFRINRILGAVLKWVLAIVCGLVIPILATLQ